MSIQSAVRYALTKAANKTPPSADALAAQLLRSEAYATAARLGLLGLGTGAAVRAGQGLAGTLSKKKKMTGETPYESVPVEVPVYTKAAGGGLPDVQLPNSIWPRSNYSWNGVGARGPGDMPWYYPLLGASLLGGTYVGHKSLDTVLDKRRQKATDDELARAKAHYESVLRANATDKSAAALEKLAISAGELMGLYLTAAGAAGLGAASYGYSNAQQTSRRRVLEDAVKARKQQLRGERPPAMYAVPKLVNAPAVPT